MMTTKTDRPQREKDEPILSLPAIVSILVATTALLIFVVIIAQKLDGSRNAQPDHGGQSADAVLENFSGTGEEDFTIEVPDRSFRHAAPWGGGTVTGTVCASDGTPSAGAVVRVIALPDQVGYWEAGVSSVRTGEDGAFEMPLPFPGVFRLLAEKGQARSWIDGVSPGATVKLALHDPAQTTVCVENIDPAAPAEAVLRQVYPESGLEIDGVRRGMNFVFDQTPPGYYFLSIRAGDSFAECAVESFAGEAARVSLLLPPAVDLAGVVKDAFGQPLTDATVTASSAATGKRVDRVVSDGDGAFCLFMPVGVYRLEVDKKGFLSTHVPMARPGVPQEVVLTEGALWTGQVVDARGAALANARVRVEYGAPLLGRRRHRDLVVAPTGEFLWRSATDQKERFLVSAPGFGPRCFESVIPAHGPAARLEPFVLFAQTLTVGGVVRDDHGGSVAQARVTLVSDAVPPGSPVYREMSATTDRSGLFQFPDAAKGPFSLYVDGGGFGRAMKKLFLSGDELIVLSVPTSREVAGAVTGSAGFPLEGAAISLSSGGRDFTVRSDRQGRFRFTDVPEKTGPIAVRGGAAMAASSGDELVLTLPEGGALAGRIVDEEGRPVRYFRAAALLPGEGARGARPTWVTADGEGRFRLTLPAKPSAVLFSKPGYEDLLLPGENLVLDGQTYRLESGGPVQIIWSGISRA